MKAEARSPLPRVDLARQVCKYLGWADANKVAIDALDFAAPAERGWLPAPLSRGGGAASPLGLWVLGDGRAVGEPFARARGPATPRG